MCAAGAAVAWGLSGGFAWAGLFAGEPAPTGTVRASGSRCTCGSGFSREHRRSRCHAPRHLLRGLARSHRYCAGFGITQYLWERPWPRTPAQPVPFTEVPASRACLLPQVLRWLQVHGERTPAQPVPYTEVPTSRACPLPQVLRWLRDHAVPVGATVLLNFKKLARSLWERACPRTPAQPVPCTASPDSRACPLPQVLRWLQVHGEPVGAALAANTGAAGAIHRGACFAGLPAPTNAGDIHS